MSTGAVTCGGRRCEPRGRGQARREAGVRVQAAEAGRGRALPYRPPEGAASASTRMLPPPELETTIIPLL